MIVKIIILFENNTNYAEQYMKNVLPILWPGYDYTWKSGNVAQIQNRKLKRQADKSDK